ncbi:MAG: LysM peptidoglycan-binding domain-containing protein [Bacteroidetes bacterium]|nr:LysM peptidoglycan-binding domain-containing protein [Fibrella sp.]
MPASPSEIEFAGVLVQLTPTARQRLQRSLDVLYIDRALLLHHIETLNQLRPLLDPRLAAQGIPLDFRYACPPFTDSTYDPYAYWGLDKQQASQLQLWVNSSVDSRRHIILTTESLLPSLNQFQQRNKHWIRTLFQHLNPLVSQLATANDSTRWVLDIEAPAAIWAILARKIAFEHEQSLLQLTPTFILVEYDEGAGKTLLEIANRLKISVDRLAPYNNWLLTDRIPESGNFPVILRLPPEEYLSVKIQLASKGIKSTDDKRLSGIDLGFPILRRLDAEPARKSVIFYQINNRRGVQAQLCDNAITLSYYGKLSIPVFLAMNDLPSQDIVLKPGDVYYLQRKAKRAKIPFHVVQQSQTLWDISAVYGIRLKSLLRFNRMKPAQRVQTGRIVWMQRRRPRRYPVEYQSAPPNDRELPVQPTLVTTDPRPSVDSTIRDPTRSELVSQAATSDTVSVSPRGRPRTRDPNLARSVIPGTVTKIHVVKPKQTYFSIAKLYGTTVAELCAWNNVSARQPLQIGQELLIGTLGKTATLNGSRQPTAVAKSPLVKPVGSLPIQPIRYYTVKLGETVYRIARNNAVSIEELMRWNGLKDFTLEIGQRLIIRQKGR